MKPHSSARAALHRFTWVPHRKAVVTAALTVVLGGLLAAASACNEFFAPCTEQFRSNTIMMEGDSRFMDGTWALFLIDGQAIPSTGYALPLGAGKLQSGTIDFATLYLDEGKCSEPKKTRGEVIALYRLLDASGASKVKTQIGSFDFDDASAAVTLRALGESIVGARALNRMTVTAPIPVKVGGVVISTIEYKLEFLRSIAGQ